MHLVSREPLVEAREPPEGLPSFPRLRDATAYATVQPTALLYIGQVERGRIVRVRLHHNLPPPQVALFPVTCKTPECRQQFHPLRRGRRPEYCPTCRPEQRDRVFRERARRRRPAAQPAGDADEEGHPPLFPGPAMSVRPSESVRAQSRRQLGVGAVLSVDQAVALLPWGPAFARGWLVEQKLISRAVTRGGEVKECVVWAAVVDRLWPAGASAAPPALQEVGSAGGSLARVETRRRT